MTEAQSEPQPDAVLPAEDLGPRHAYLTAVRDQPRARRAADVTTVVAGLLLLAWALLTQSLAEGFEATLTEFAKALPEWAVALLSLAYTAGLLYAIAVVVALVVGRRWSGLRDVAIAVIVGTVVVYALVSKYGHLWPPIFPEFQEHSGDTQFPVVRVTLVTAVLVASTPYVARPIRRVGWTILVLVAAAAVALAYGLPGGALGAVGVGMVAAGAVLLVFGSPSGYPDAGAVVSALHRVGIEVTDLAVAHDQSWGVRRLIGTTTAGQEVEVKAYGRDATDSQVMAKVWHVLMYRGAGRKVAFSRLQSVEHEALVTMLAERAGVQVPKVLAAASASEEVAVLVTGRQGTPLSEIHPALLSDSMLVDLWRDVATLHDAGITHGALTGDAVMITPGDHVIGELASGSVVFRESDAALDVTHLLYALAVVVGVDRAVTSAVEGLGRDRLARALGYLQPPALTTRERRQVRKPSQLLTQLRKSVAEATQTSVPEPVKLRRVGVRQIATVIILVMFLAAIVPVLAGVDYATLWAELQNATWWMVVLAVLIGQVVFIPQALAMMFAVARSIPLRPMTVLQPAVTFISFAVPGMAGRVTMESAFLYKYGVPPAVSVTKGAIDAFSGFLVQVVLLVLALATGAITLTSTSQDGSSGPSVSLWVIIVVVALAIATVVAIWRVPKLHDRVVPEIAKGWQALAEVLRSPTRAVGLLGCNLLVQLLWGLAMWLALRALGTDLSLITCTAVVVGTCLLQGLVPVPGGVGVSEAVIAALLAPMGVSGSVALAAAAIWRVATFYLPATEGFFAAKWLSKRGYL